MRSVPTRVHSNGLFAADHQAVDADGWSRNRAAEFEVVSDFGNVEEQLFQVSSDRDFFDWVCEFATGDPEAGCAARIVAGDQICAVAQELSYVQAFVDFCDNLLWRFVPG